jgi:hypothetical protein
VDRLARALAAEIPERDVDEADRAKRHAALAARDRPGVEVVPDRRRFLGLATDSGTRDRGDDPGHRRASAKAVRDALRPVRRHAAPSNLVSLSGNAHPTSRYKGVRPAFRP